MRLTERAALLVVGLCAVCAVSMTGCGTASSDGSGTGGTTDGPKAPGVPKPTTPDDDGPSSGGSSGIPNTGPCVGAPGELYAISARGLGSLDQVPLCKFKGRVLLIVNVASQCGYTPQYGPLQELYKRYVANGFDVLGFPSASFDQELSDEKDISAFCTKEYQITFPMFALGNVNPPDEQPVYGWLKAEWMKTHPEQSRDIAWNFEKFLVSRAGRVVGRYETAVEPTDPGLVAAIQAELAKP